MTAAQLLTILQQCYSHNGLNNVTGMLLYGNGTFLQALEGDEDVIASLYQSIESDRRHSNVTCLSRKTITTRRYPGWCMEFCRMPALGWGNAGDRRRMGENDFTVDFLVEDPGARDALLTYFSPSETSGPGHDAQNGEVARLQKALRRAEGAVEIARLVLEDIVEAHAAGRVGNIQEKLCRFALGQINGI